MAADGESLAKLAWSHRPDADRGAELPSVTPESKALAKELKRRGFRFVGPTTAYALMQATGIVNDHLPGCFVRDTVAAERAEAIEEL
jgi:DNA-3-methyladenine glycosylase I